jgi:hypothetical protein
MKSPALSRGESRRAPHADHGGIRANKTVPKGFGMAEKPDDLDQHRGMAAQKATLLRRSEGAARADQKALKTRQEELEHFMLAKPAKNWPEAAERATYLLKLFAQSPTADDPRRQKLIHSVLADFDRLGGTES